MPLRHQVVLWFSLGFLAAASEKTCQATSDCNTEEDQALLQLRHNSRSDSDWPLLSSRYDMSGKSVYLIMIDRFNRVSPLNATENPKCVEEQNWCGGTLKGITEKVEYIRGMGFDAIWITPVVKQPSGQDKGGNCTTTSGYSYHGYWAQDYYEIDPSYGSSQDLKDMVDAVHRAGMEVILDIVLNHMRGIHQQEDDWKVEGLNPFNSADYFHRRKPLDRPGGEDFVAYTEKHCDWPSPFQAIGPGSMCYLTISNETGRPDYTNGGNYCNNYKSPGFGKPMVYNNETYLGKDAAGPPNLAYCGVGDYCEGYTNEAVWEGWFFDLGDLNHSHPFVRKKQYEWIRMMRTKYDLDGIRLDTTPYMPWTYLKKFQEMAHPLQIMGEVTTSNLTFHSSFQYNTELKNVLAGMENFPPFYAATPGYCNDSGNQLSPVAMGTLKVLGRTMEEQINSGLYTNVGTLMNFMDNQDYSPIFNYCKGTATLIKNGLAWAIMSYGMPVITWGTEQGNTVYRQMMWELGFSTRTWQYNFIRKLNWVRKLKIGRKRQRVATAPTKVVNYSDTQLVFVRGGFKHGVWTFTNNLNTSAPVVYPVAPPSKPNCWVDILSGRKPKIVGGHLMAPNSDPVVLYRWGKSR